MRGTVGGKRSAASAGRSRGSRRGKRSRRPQAAPYLESLLWKVGLRHVAGADEAGMGPLAGPVVGAAVIFSPGFQLEGLADSKRLTPAVREELAEEIRRRALAVSVACIEPEEIDRLNIYRAGLRVLKLAVAHLAPRPEFVLVDGREIPGLSVPQCAYPKGDGFVSSIAAASIIAKVHRDALLRELDARYPGYGFANHFGYATPEHLAALRRLGPSPVHRRSFAPVRAVCRSRGPLFTGIEPRRRA